MTYVLYVKYHDGHIICSGLSSAGRSEGFKKTEASVLGLWNQASLPELRNCVLKVGKTHSAACRWSNACGGRDLKYSNKSC